MDSDIVKSILFLIVSFHWRRLHKRKWSLVVMTYVFGYWRMYVGTDCFGSPKISSLLLWWQWDENNEIQSEMSNKGTGNKLKTNVQWALLPSCKFCTTPFWVEYNAAGWELCISTTVTIKMSANDKSSTQPSSRGSTTTNTTKTTTKTRTTKELLIPYIAITSLFLFIITTNLILLLGTFYAPRTIGLYLTLPYYTYTLC